MDQSSKFSWKPQYGFSENGQKETAMSDSKVIGIGMDDYQGRAYKIAEQILGMTNLLQELTTAGCEARNGDGLLI